MHWGERIGRYQVLAQLSVGGMAELFLNVRSLGKTPLFKKPVPVGRHLLRIQGENGKRRVLSVPIEAGKTAQFRLGLTDIPEG